MKTRMKILGAAVAVVATAAVVAATWSSKSPEVPEVERARAASDGPALADANAGPAACELPAGWEATYDYRGQVDSVVAIGTGQNVDGRNRFSGTLAFRALEPDADGSFVLLGQLSNVNDELRSAHGPELETPFLVKVGRRCEVRGFARRQSTSKRIGQVQQVAMHDLWVFAPAGDGVEPVTFANGTGRARGEVQRRGDVVHRTIRGYDQGWHMRGGVQVLASQTRAQLGGGWFESFESQESFAGGAVKLAKLTLSVQRQASPTLEVSADASRKPTDYVWENLLGEDPSGMSAAPGAVPATERRYMEAMRNGTLESAFETMHASVQRHANVEEQWHEMAGFLNGHKEAIGEFAQGLRAADFPEDTKGVAYLALGKTVHPEAREALMELRTDRTLTNFDRVRANLALVTRKDVGLPLAQALKRDALNEQTRKSEPLIAEHAMLHLGVLAATHREDRDVYDVARSTIDSALGAAGSEAAKLAPVFGSIGNLADKSLLTKISDFSRADDVEVRALLPRALRGYAYADTEPLVLEWLARETSPEVKQEIFNVVHHQLADAQRHASAGLVREAMRHLALQPTVFARQSIIHLLGPTKAEFPEVRPVLMAQAATEFRSRSGLYSQVVSYLTPEETNVVLAEMPEFAHQFGTAARQQAANAMEQTTPRSPVGPDGAPLRPHVFPEGM